jgi:LacI family transcriptional regulator
MEVAQARRDGYKQALLEMGIPIAAELMVEGFFREDAGYRAMLQLLDLAEPPTAVFAASDAMALGALQAVRHRRLRVPEDVAVVGFDDLALAAYATPPLTTVHQPIGEMGARAVQLVIDQIRGNEEITSVRLSAHLVVRESSGGEVTSPSPNAHIREESLRC